MGANQSARKLTVTNDDNTRLINVSTALVERLAQGTSESSAKNVENVRSPSLPQQVHPNNVSVTAPAGATPSGIPVYYYLPEYTMSALEMQQQKERELSNQEQYWQKRMQNMEKNHARVNQILEEEYKKAVDEFTNSKGKTDEIQGSITPCLQNSEQVLKCYQDHPKETLKCAELVEQFSNCVDQRRARVIAAR